MVSMSLYLCQCCMLAIAMEPNQEPASNTTDIAGDEGPRVNPIFSSVLPATPSSPTGPASPSLQPIPPASSTDNQQTTQAAGSLVPSLGPSPTPSSGSPPRQEEAPAVVGSVRGYLGRCFCSGTDFKGLFFAEHMKRPFLIFNPTKCVI